MVAGPKTIVETASSGRCLACGSGMTVLAKTQVGPLKH
ncbi:hypothetical protein NJ7G_1923 [Natrinema sp. J7-2]|nr:hypothetical protein NJ7G_1923 [Natrinema sp. J7-2]